MEPLDEIGATVQRGANLIRRHQALATLAPCEGEWIEPEVRSTLTRPQRVKCPISEARFTRLC